jgi:hypothetical protein
VDTNEATPLTATYVTPAMGYFAVCMLMRVTCRTQRVPPETITRPPPAERPENGPTATSIGADASLSFGARASENTLRWPGGQPGKTMTMISNAPPASHALRRWSANPEKRLALPAHYLNE